MQTLGNDTNWHHKIGDIRSEILFAIKEHLNLLNGKNHYGAVGMEGLTIVDRTISPLGTAQYLSLQNIFIDEHGRLCADFVNKEYNSGNDLVLGKNIEGLFVEELMKIVNKLYEKRSADCPIPQLNHLEPEISQRKPLFPHLKSLVKGKMCVTN